MASESLEARGTDELIRPAIQIPRPDLLAFAYRIIALSGTLLTVICLLQLALRAALRLELRWDTFLYHIPFAARHAGLPIHYEFLPRIQNIYEGYAPLPELVQGMFWRLTGSIHATGIVNYVALVLFLWFAWRILHANFTFLALICLMTPMVIIHAASSYADLFTNALLAIGVTAFLRSLLFDSWLDPKLFFFGLLGTTAAAWAKLSTLPIVACVLFSCLGIYGFRRYVPKRGRYLLCVLGALVIALTPYAKNWILYQNPLWPFRMPVGQFPYTIDSRLVRLQQVPPSLRDASQPELFFRSLFEIGHPTHYPDRERWIIDQGNADIAFRSGGFWNVGISTAMLTATFFGFLTGRRQGAIVSVAIAFILLLVSVLPQSHELRYFQFIPLTIAALASMLAETARRKSSLAVLIALGILAGEFVWITRVNRNHYRIERIGYDEAAVAWKAQPYWKDLQPGATYCAVGFEPAGFLLTGPTMQEFGIIDRAGEKQCPPNIPVIRRP